MTSYQQIYQGTVDLLAGKLLDGWLGDKPLTLGPNESQEGLDGWCATAVGGVTLCWAPTPVDLLLWARREGVEVQR